jgi:hypothetical protein
MTTKLLTFFDIARLGVPAGARFSAYSRTRAEASSSPARGIGYIPRLRAPLECRWQIDPLTGGLVAVWFNPSTNTVTKTVAEAEVIDARRCRRQLRQAVRGRAVRCHVGARRAA